MDQKIKFAIYFIIIASEVDYLWSRPVNSSFIRQKRQVVQPKWLLEPEIFFGDSNVHVTDQNLKEAAAIRDAIQKAISSGTFAVNVEQPNARIPPAERSQTATEKPKLPNFELPQFEMPEFDRTLFNFSDFGLPELDISEFDPTEFFTPEQRTSFVRQINHFWQVFWNNSQKVFSSLN